jgi:DNA-directed RNA polymerase subunit RPC12/RpoP
MKKITLKDLHEMNNKYPERRNIHLAHQYDKKSKEWKFVGYKCSRCGRTFVRPGFIDNHDATCNPIATTLKRDQGYEEIRTVKGEKWRPFI